MTIEGVSISGDPDAHLYEDGAMLPGPSATLAGPTFEEWLDSAQHDTPSQPGSAARTRTRT